MPENRDGNSQADDEPPVDRLLLSRAGLQCDPVLLRIRGAAASLVRLQRSVLRLATVLGSTKLRTPLRRQTWLHLGGCRVDLRGRGGASRRFLGLTLCLLVCL